MEKLNLNKLRQQQEEKRAVNSVYDKIVSEFITLEHTGSDSKKPDFRLNYNGKNICIEMTRIEPYKNRGLESQCEIVSAVEKLVRRKVKEIGISPVCTIHIILGPTLSILKRGRRIKNIINIDKVIENALKGRVDKNYFTEFRVNKKIGDRRLMNDKKYVASLKIIERLTGKPLPEIVFSNPGCVLESITEDDISMAINHKEKEYDDYKYQRGENFDEVWLCLYLPDTEFGFTIRGAITPPAVSKFDRIYLSEEKMPFARLIYCKDSSKQLDI